MIAFFGIKLIKGILDCKFNKFDEGWAAIHKAITKLKRILEGLLEPPFTTEEYLTSYTSVYNICNERPPNNHNVERLYHEYCKVCEEHIATMVLPPLSGKHGESMLRELAQRWGSYKVMIRRLSRFFIYLDRFYTNRKHLPTLHEVAIVYFRDAVYMKLNAKVIDVMISLIERDREGEQVDRAVLRNVVDMFVTMDIGEELKYYQQDFEAAMLEDTAEDSGFLALLRDDKVEDLSRILKLYNDIPEGLDLGANIFKQKITSEGTSLVQQAENASTSLVTEIVKLHDKYTAYLTGCFENHAFF
ncbi:hypothetical protein TIFTF001_012410 [Ficus carica]|uniref:Cullin N-terminal domain-containing protein n=1 Tax=Ficus carica TaxID=3494 RepID=A0AA87ZZY3_FICCA|nr:hypothetical protein TIFTF001_012410 [Ficus carica]